MRKLVIWQRFSLALNRCEPTVALTVLSRDCTGIQNILCNALHEVLSAMINLQIASAPTLYLQCSIWSFVLLSLQGQSSAALEITSRPLTSTWIFEFKSPHFAYVRNKNLFSGVHTKKFLRSSFLACNCDHRISPFDFEIIYMIAWYLLRFVAILIYLYPPKFTMQVWLYLTVAAIQAPYPRLRLGLP